MLRKIIWFVVAIAILVVVYLAYEYNAQVQEILSSINFGDMSSLTDKAKEIAEQASSGEILSWDILSGTEEVLSGVVNDLSGTIVEVMSGAEETLSGIVN